MVKINSNFGRNSDNIRKVQTNNEPLNGSNSFVFFRKMFLTQRFLIQNILQNLKAICLGFVEVLRVKIFVKNNCPILL